MDNLAEEMDQVMSRLERAGMAHCAPKLNPKQDPSKWLSDKGAPWKLLVNEKSKGVTIAYDTHFECMEKRQSQIASALGLNYSRNGHVCNSATRLFLCSLRAWVYITSFFDNGRF